MPTIQLALTDSGLCVFRQPAAGLADPGTALSEAIAELAPGAPVVVMLHGKGYRPGLEGNCPHQLLYSERHTALHQRYVSWPRRLGLAQTSTAGSRGLAIGFGWDGCGSIWSASRAADRAAPELARLINLIRHVAPDKQVDLLGHSLGARIMLGALPFLPAGAVGRMLLLAGAELQGRARTALDSPAGRTAEAINIISRENDIFDWLFETALAPASGNRAIGAGLGDLPNAVDIQIDGSSTRSRLAELGFRLPEPQARICHWSVYLCTGIFRLYRRLLFQRSELPLDRLRTVLGSARPDPRWASLARRLPDVSAIPKPEARAGQTAAGSLAF